MAGVTKNTVVSIEYTLRNSAGQVIDASEGRGPLTYLHGVGMLIPGMETALESRVVGDDFEVVIPPEQAYGQRDPAMVQPVPVSAFKDAGEIKTGMQFYAQTPGGRRVVTVVEVSDTEVTVDANHELAGQTLQFAVKVVGLRDATKEEIEHGHIHDAQDHNCSERHANGQCCGKHSH